MFTVRQFEARDWPTYKAIRLEALSRHEDKFGASFTAESAWRDSQWEYMLGKPDQAFFGLYDGDTLIGSTGVVTDKFDKSGKGAVLIASYIREDYRGRGLSRLLYAARIQWVIESGRYKRVIVGHKEGNEASRRANQAFGFEYIGPERTQWGDGSEAIKHNYEMRIAI